MVMTTQTGKKWYLLYNIESVSVGINKKIEGKKKICNKTSLQYCYSTNY